MLLWAFRTRLVAEPDSAGSGHSRQHKTLQLRIASRYSFAQATFRDASWEGGRNDVVTPVKLSEPWSGRTGLFKTTAISPPSFVV